MTAIGRDGCGTEPGFMTSEAIIVFLKDPDSREVKTRLARTIGQDKARKVYRQLVEGVKQPLLATGYDIILFYAENIPQSDTWGSGAAARHIQDPGDLGHRMSDAFQRVFSQGYHKAVLIGTDILGLQTEYIKSAFSLLDELDIVGGPARDGGYYLIGMKQPHPEIFELEAWSHVNVWRDTRLLCEKYHLSYATIATLQDVDEEEDLSGME